MYWSPGVAGFDGSPRRAAQSVTAAPADFLQVEQVQFSRVVHQIPHLHTLMPSQRDGNGVRWTSVDTGSFQSAQIDSLERLSSRNGKHLKKWLSSRDYCRVSPPRIVPQRALRRGWRLGVSWRWVAVAKQRFLHHCGGGCPQTAGQSGGVSRLLSPLLSSSSSSAAALRCRRRRRCRRCRRGSRLLRNSNGARRVLSSGADLCSHYTPRCVRY